MDVRFCFVQVNPPRSARDAEARNPALGTIAKDNVMHVDFANESLRRRHLRNIFTLAARVELDDDRILHWFRFERIEELGACTAEELCRAGFAPVVERYLMAIIAGERG